MFKSQREPSDFFGSVVWTPIFKAKGDVWSRVCFRSQRLVLSVDLWVFTLWRGLSAAGVEVESEWSRRVQAASQECLSLSALRTVGVWCSWWGTRGGRDGVYAAAVLMQDSHPKKKKKKKYRLLPSKLANNTGLLDSKKCFQWAKNCPSGCFTDS